MKYLFITVSLMLLSSGVFAQSFTRLEQMIIDTTTERINTGKLSNDPNQWNLLYFKRATPAKQTSMKQTILSNITKTEKELVPVAPTPSVLPSESQQATVFFHRATQLESLGKTVDYEKVRTTWMQRVNEVRNARGLDTYSYDHRLEYSAGKWTDIMVARGKRSHQRTIGDGYYNYRNIEQRFTDLGIKFKNVQRSTFTENVGQPYFRCTQTDCTDAVISSLRTTFDRFMAEEGKRYDAHFRTIVHPRFTIGGIAFDVKGSSLFTTMHYGTEIVE